MILGTVKVGNKVGDEIATNVWLFPEDTALDLEYKCKLCKGFLAGMSSSLRIEALRPFIVVVDDIHKPTKTEYWCIHCFLVKHPNLRTVLKYRGVI